MAELPEVRGTQLPDRRPLYDRPPSFGVARDAELMRQGIPPPPIRRQPSRSSRRASREVDRAHPLDHRIWQCRSRARDAPLYGRTWTHLRHRWSSGENGPADVWHRLMCRRGRHDFRGGQLMQLGSRPVFIERRCIWCDAAPG